MYYLDTQTIENAYNSLTSLELGDQGANAMFEVLYWRIKKGSKD